MVVLPCVVCFAEDHIALGEAGGTDISQHGSTTGALEAPVVPIAIERMQQEPLHYLSPATSALLHTGPVVIVVVIVGLLHVRPVVVVAVVDGVVWMLVRVWMRVVVVMRMGVRVAPAVGAGRVWGAQLRVGMVVGVHGS